MSTRDDLRAQYTNMEACIRCGLCLSVCPTYQLSAREEEGPRGRIAVAKAVAEGNLELTDDAIVHQQSCLLCDACTDICPAGVRMEPIGMAFRQVIARERGIDGNLRRGLDVVGSPGTLGALSRLGAVAQRTGLRRLASATGIPRALGLGEADRLMPEFDVQPFAAAGQVWQPEGCVKARVALFTGCIMSTAFAEVHRATVRLLLGAGCEVTVPRGQGCCGALHAHQGLVDQAQSMRANSLSAMHGFDAVILNSAGCGAWLKHESALPIRDLTEWLNEIGLPGGLRCIERRVVYQDACHLLHAQGIAAPPRRLLDAVPGVHVATIAEAGMCCGSAGVYNLIHSETARELGARKAAAILAVEPDEVVSANPGCILQVRAALRDAGSSIPVRHIAELLAEALPIES